MGSLSNKIILSVKGGYAVQVFDAGKGLFHLFFSNDEDKFYTPSYVKTNLTFHLYSRLTSMNYEYVYSFTGEGYHNCIFTSLDNISADAMDEKSSSGMFGGIFGGRRQNTASALTGTERKRSGQKSVSLDQNNLGENFKNLISLMKRKSKVAVIIPIGIFSALVQYPDITEELQRINAKNYQDNNRHIFVITSSMYSGESLRFFKPTAETSAEGNIFCDSGLFPDLEDYFHDFYNSSMNFYIYDNLKRFMGDKMVFYHSLSYEHIRRMITRYAIHTDYIEEMSLQNINALTGVIYAYYHSSEYRKEHHLAFPENPKRILSEIETALRNDRKLRSAAAEAGKDLAKQKDIYKYICNNYSECVDSENSIYMIGGGSYGEEVGKLRAVKKICIGRYGECPADLDKAINILSKPCVDSAVSFSAASFREKIIDIAYKNIVNELTDYVDLGLVEFMLKALNYYFDYFQTVSALKGDAVTAKDLSFDFYKNVMYLAEKLSRAKKSQKELQDKIVLLESKGDMLSAESTKLYLEKTESFIQNLERTIENAENMLSSPVSETNARSVMSGIKHETQNLKKIGSESDNLYN